MSVARETRPFAHTSVVHSLVSRCDLHASRLAGMPGYVATPEVWRAVVKGRAATSTASASVLRRAGHIALDADAGRVPSRLCTSRILGGFCLSRGDLRPGGPPDVVPLCCAVRWAVCWAVWSSGTERYLQIHDIACHTWYSPFTL